MSYFSKDRRQPGGDRQNLGTRIILGIHIINIAMEQGDGDPISSHTCTVGQKT